MKAWHLVLAGWIPAAALLAGCAGSRPKADPLLIRYERFERDAANLISPGGSSPTASSVAPASELLDAARNKRQEAETLRGKKGGRALLEEAVADARAASAAAQAALAGQDADSCLRSAEAARRNWDEALRILMETEQVARHTSEGVPHQVPGIDRLSPPQLPATTVSDSDLPAGSAVDLSGAFKSWLEAALSNQVPVADLQERFEGDIAAASSGNKAQRDLALYRAGRTLQELEWRVRAETSARVCPAASGLITDLASATDDARQGTLELERGLREDLRSELEKTRQEAADRQNQLYEALQQIQGKYAQITRDARGTIISLADILFDFNKATLKRDVEFSLVRVATILNQFPEMKIAVEGHTDNVGTAEYNLDLSKRRAQAVADFLASQGVSADRMTVAGYGMTRPVADNSTEEGRQKNRRVDLVVQD